jgi:hypothetical protein
MFASKADYEKARTSAVTASLNIHPNWRTLSLSHIRMVRNLARRDPNQRGACATIIKQARLDMVYCRNAIVSALAAH